METIAINPIEQKRIPTVRSQIIARDKYCTFPFLVNGQLEGISYYGKADYGAVHHVTPFSFLKRHRPLVDPNHPLNLITIPHNEHAMLHREWVNYYGKNPELIKEMVLERGARGWVTDYDETLTSMAIIRSARHMESDLDYFPQYRNNVMSHYSLLDPDFVARYDWFSRRFEQ